MNDVTRNDRKLHSNSSPHASETIAAIHRLTVPYGSEHSRSLAKHAKIYGVFPTETWGSEMIILAWTHEGGDTTLPVVASVAALREVFGLMRHGASGSRCRESPGAFS